ALAMASTPAALPPSSTLTRALTPPHTQQPSPSTTTTEIAPPGTSASPSSNPPLPSPLHSTTPPLQHSNPPTLQPSKTPPLHPSITPIFHPSNLPMTSLPPTHQFGVSEIGPELRAFYEEHGF